MQKEKPSTCPSKPKPICCVHYGEKGPTKPIPPIPMSRTDFLNAASITDHIETEKWNDKPYTLFGKVPDNHFPTVKNFKATLTKLARLEEVVIQKEILIESEEDTPLTSTKRRLKVGEKRKPREKLYLQTNLTNKEALTVVENGFQQWMDIGGTLSRLFPDKHNMSTVGFLFSESGSVVGIHEQNYKFGSINILFSGKKAWDVFPPQQNREIVKQLELNTGEKLVDKGCPSRSLHKSVFVGEDTKQMFKAVSFVQHPGEVIFIPPGGVLHQVHALSNCVAAAYNFVDMTWVKMDLSEVMSTCSCMLEGEPVLMESDVKNIRQNHLRINSYALSLMKSLILESTRDPSSCVDAPNILELANCTSEDYEESRQKQTSPEKANQNSTNGSNVLTASANNGGNNEEDTANLQVCPEYQVMDTRRKTTEFPNEGNAGKGKKYYCKTCRHECDSWSKLVYHQNKHRELMFTCPKCQKNFGQLRYLKQHQRHKRCEPKLYDCKCSIGKELTLRRLRYHSKICPRGKELCDTIPKK